MITNKLLKKAVPCTQEPQSHSKDVVSLMSIGPPGCGRSTIGNVFLSQNNPNEESSLFETSPGTKSCTHCIHTKTVGDRRYIDTPSIPSTEPDNPIANYNQCIDTIKEQEISALLFVFKMERIDNKKYEMANLLFREINKANCIKILVIHDMSSVFQKPTEKDFQLLAAKIQRITQIDFAVSMAVDFSNMREKLDELVVLLRKSRVEPLSSPKLRNFSQVQKWVDYLQKTQDYRTAILQEKNAKRDSIKTYADSLTSFLNLVKVAAGFMFFAMASPELIDYCSEMWGDDMTLKLLPSTKRQTQTQENENTNDQRSTDGSMDEAIVELQAAKDYFEQLSKLMEVKYYYN